MTDENKSIKDALLKSIFATLSAITEESTSSDEKRSTTIRDLVVTLAQIAGRSKDEIVQIISREIGVAIAGIIKEPVEQVIRNRKIQVTIEFVPNDKPKDDLDESKKKDHASSKTKTKTQKKKN